MTAIRLTETRVNAKLRSIMEREQNSGDPAAQLRQAKGLIDAALRSVTR